MNTQNNQSKFEDDNNNKSLMDKAKDTLTNIKDRAQEYIGSGGSKNIIENTNDNLNQNNNLNMLQENTKENLNSGWDNNVDVPNKDTR